MEQEKIGDVKPCVFFPHQIDDRGVPDKDALWLEAVQGLGQTTKRFLHHRSTSTDEYPVFDATEAKFLDVSDEAESA